MSAGGSADGAHSSINGNHLLLLGIIGGLVGIYLCNINGIIGPVLAGLGTVCATVWGANAIRSVASYGLGTGVPSIGYMCLSISIIGVLAGLALGFIFPDMPIVSTLGPVIGLIFAMIIATIVGLIATKIVGMKIPIMVRCTAEIAGAGALSVLGLSAAVTGFYNATDIFNHVVANGFIALFFIMCTMAIQHPFNACLGPNEDQSRTLKCATSTAFLSMMITGLVSSVAGDVFGWLAVFIVGLIGWIISFRAFVKASYDAAASVKWAGLWPKVEE